MSVSPVARWGTAPRGHEGLAVTRALFGAGVLWVECRNSDQGAGGRGTQSSYQSPGDPGSKPRFLSSQWKGWNSVSAAEPRQPLPCHLLSECNPPSFYEVVPCEPSQPARLANTLPAPADPDGPGEGRAGSPAAAPEQAGAGGGHDGPEQLSHPPPLPNGRLVRRPQGGLQRQPKLGGPWRRPSPTCAECLCAQGRRAGRRLPRLSPPWLGVLVLTGVGETVPAEPSVPRAAATGQGDSGCSWRPWRRR